jgi:hypothetical protein
MSDGDSASVLVELLFGIAGERRSLEELALPLTMAEAERRDESAAPEDDLDPGIAGRA